jgi:ubiquinone biosynthesis protein COQ9
MDNESIKFDKKKQIILNRALIDIKNFGFNKKMLHIAAKNCSISDGELGRLFPEGIFELKQYFFSTIDKKMLKKIENQDYNNMRIRDKIYNGVIIRLDLFKK